VLLVLDKPHHESGSFNVANHGLVYLPDQPHPASGGDHLARVGRLARTEVLSLDAE
jgi:hypothetical protein